MEVIYKHCSALISFTEYNIKMFHNYLRSYEEDWQRRRSRRVDSLFLDLPVLSPVPEESREFTNNTQNIPRDDVSDHSSRSNSSLPSLIIETLPDKHDDSEECYVKLEKRIFKAYKRLFIENRSLSSGVFDSISNSNSSDENDREFNNNARDRYDSHSDGNEDDSESMETTTIEEVTESNKSSHGHGIEDSDMSRADDEESSQSLASTYIINSEESVNPNLVEIERPRPNQSIQNMFRKDLRNTRIDDDDHVNESSRGSAESQEKNEYEEIVEEASNETKTDSNFVDNQSEGTVSGEEGLAVEAVMGECGQTNLSSVGADYRQINTTAIVHVDGSQHPVDRESPIYEGSVRSVILPTGPVARVTASRDYDMQAEFEDEAGVEDTEDPPTILTYLSSENVSTVEEIEQMRSGEPDISQESISITHHRDSETAHQSTGYLGGPADMMSSPQNGGANDQIDVSSSGSAASREKIEYEEEIHEKASNGNKTDSIGVDNESEGTASSGEGLAVTEAAMDESSENNLSSEGADYRQITTTAIVHVDGSQHPVDRESPIYEGSVRSVILPTGPFARVTASRDDDLQAEFDDVARVEDNGDPPTILTYLSSENESTVEEVEPMRSGQPDIFQESIPINHQRNSETAHQPIGYLEDPADMTSSPQNGGHNKNLEYKISSDINDILNYIFNESRNNNENNLSVFRKRKASNLSDNQKDQSAQTTETFNWDDQDIELSLTRAKVFRLCACKDHVCT